MPTTSETSPSRPWPLSLFAPAPPAPIIATDPQEIRDGFRHWQPRILFASTLGYAVFYFVRANLSVAMPAIERDLHFSKTDLGFFLTAHGVIYGLSKFFNGFLGDRSNARIFMAVGLILSAICNFVFGSSSLAIVMGVTWMLNGYFQGMGFPPCARLLTHWFPPRQLATKMSIWNMSHCIGASLIVILCGYLVTFSWRLCFYVPGIIALITTVYLLVFLRDTPESLGLPNVDALEENAEPRSPAKDQTEESYGFVLLNYVFNNPWIWLMALANFFVYTIRYSILNWAPTFLTQDKHIYITSAGWMTAAFEGCGMIGAMVAGWLTDKYFGGRGPRVALIGMILCGVSLFAFWRLPAQTVTTSTLLLCAIGFFIYIPQCLVGITAAKLATRRAAAAAVGLTGLFAYLSTLLSGVGLGWLVQHHGWPAGFKALIFVAGFASLLFAIAWPASAEGNHV